MKIVRIRFREYVTPPGSGARTLTIVTKEGVEAHRSEDGVVVIVKPKKPDERARVELYPWAVIGQVEVEASERKG